MEQGSEEEQEEEPGNSGSQLHQALNSNLQQQTDATEEKHLRVHLLLLAGDQSSCCPGSDCLDQEAAELEPEVQMSPWRLHLLLLLLPKGNL